MWSNISKITHYKGPKRTVDDSDATLPDRLNEFYSRFDRDNNTTPVYTPVPDDAPPPFTISEHEVRCVFNSQKPNKAAGPDALKPCFLKSCSNEISPIFTQIFNWSLKISVVPSCFKMSNITPVPKKSSPESLNDYRPVALTSCVMKCFEKIVLKFMNTLLPPCFDTFQFAYREKRSTDDAIAINVHELLTHAERRDSYSRVLFIDYSSAFNTIIPCKLYVKLKDKLNFPVSLCNWILNFLLERPQIVKVGSKFSSSVILNTGTPQGCPISPKLYSLFTFDCKATIYGNHVFKFADDTTVTGLIRNNDDSDYRLEIDVMTKWCTDNNLFLNVSKTKEMIIDFRKNKCDIQPLIIDNTEVEQVHVFKFLGIYLSNDLSWHFNCTELLKKARQRLYFLRILASFKVNSKILIIFYRCVNESILTSNIIVWYGRATKKDLNLLSSVIKHAEYIIGVSLPSLHDIYLKRISKKSNTILKDPEHPAHKYFELLPSGKRYRHFKGNKRYINSTFPQTVRFLNCKL